MKKLLICCLLLTVLLSCGEQNSASEASLESADASMGFDGDESMELASAPNGGEQYADDRNAEPQPSKIIKTGTMMFDVKALETAKARVDSLIRVGGGYYEREQYQTDYGSIRYELIIRVPADNFETLMTRLEAGTGKLTSKEVSANDVTEEYVDLTIRLENKVAYLEQYKEILKRARTIEEILEVQEKIRVIEEEIESKKGRLKYLDSRAGLSTLRLTITQHSDAYVAEDPSFIDQLGDAVSIGVDSLRLLLLALVSIWPFLLLGLLIFLFRKPLGSVFRRSGRKA